MSYNFLLFLSPPLLLFPFFCLGGGGGCNSHNFFFPPSQRSPNSPIRFCTDEPSPPFPAPPPPTDPASIQPQPTTRRWGVGGWAGGGGTHTMFHILTSSDCPTSEFRGGFYVLLRRRHSHTLISSRYLVAGGKPIRYKSVNPAKQIAAQQ